MPLMTPWRERFKPGGRAEPALTFQLTVPALSNDTRVCEYGTPTEPSRSVVLSDVVRLTNGATVSVNVRTPTLPAVSCAWRVNEKVPAVDGVPTRKKLPGIDPKINESPDCSVKPGGNVDRGVTV